MKDKAILRIIKYAEKIINYMDGVSSYEEFRTNDEKVDAVILNLEQIGESAKKVSNEAKERYSQVTWRRIIGLRNMISHEYEGVNLDIIYEIAKIDIPELLDVLRSFED
jgi:uncharacterized protein with HEPN domain